MKNSIYLTVFAAMFVVVPASYGWVFDLDVGYDASYSTNSDRVDVNEVQQWIHEPGVMTGLSHDSAHLELDSQYSATRRMYQQEEGGRFGDENVLTGETLLDWNVVTERLSLGLEHYRTEQTISATRSSGPENRQESQRVAGNVTYTQPILGRQYLRITGTSSVNTFDETSNDSKSQDVRLAYALPLSEVRGWEIVARHAETKFDNLAEFDYELESAQVLFHSRAPTGSLEASLGYTETDPDSPLVESVSGLTGALVFQRGITTPLQWGVSLQREIGDRSLSLDAGAVSTERELELLDSGLAEVFTSTRASFDLISRRGTNMLSLNLSSDQEEYETAGRDRQVESLTLRFDRRIRGDLNFYSSISYSEADYDEMNLEDEFIEGRMQLLWEINPRLQLGGEVGYYERSSSSAAVDYSEWVGTLSISYAIFPSRDS